MKILIAIIAALALQGCMYQTVNQNDIEAAAIICGGYERVLSISADALGLEFVTCVNRKYYMINSANVESALKQDPLNGTVY